MKHVKDMTDYWCKDTITGKYTGKNVGIAVLDTGIVPHRTLKIESKDLKTAWAAVDGCMMIMGTGPM